jgi:acetyl-CoA C-acetyltransferase
LAAELNKGTVSTLVNKVCASGMKAIMLGASAIRTGDRSVVGAGGMECMSRVPHYVNIRTPTTYAHANMIDGLIHDGLTDVYNKMPMGTCTEKVNSDMGITREMQD